MAQDEVARLTARLAAAEAEVNELRARLQDLTGKLTDTQAELATTQDQVETATARAVAAVKSRASHAAGRSRATGQRAMGSAQGGMVGRVGWHRTLRLRASCSSVAKAFLPRQRPMPATRCALLVAGTDHPRRRDRAA